MRKAADKERKKNKLAVVEEIADNIYSIKFILQSLGYPVRSYSSIKSYLPALEAFDPDLVIVDMMIPGRGGYQVIRQIRDSKELQVPVLAITADAMEGNAEDVLEAGGDDYLAKPYTVGELQEKLDHWLPKRPAPEGKASPTTKGGDN